MVVILFQDGCRAIADRVGSQISGAFNGHVDVEYVAAERPTGGGHEPSWDDLLIVIYTAQKFPEEGSQFIEQFVQSRRDAVLVLPIAVDASSPQPPREIVGIKAFEYDRSISGLDDRLVNRVGAMLGLRLQGRDAKAFISYRATDGAAIARQIYDYLGSLGYRAWLDEARELDGETTILPGSPVQAQIDEALGAANIVLLIDTPDAPSSKWIRHEVQTADGLLLPILPICFRDSDDHKRGPRFPSLLALQRWVEVSLPRETADPALTSDQLQQILDETELYLCEIFRRKCRVPFVVEKEFVSRGFAWKALDKRLLMFESSKVGGRLQTRICSHCSIFDQIYAPALDRFCKFLKDSGKTNFSLFIYDGDLLAPQVIEELAPSPEESVILLHHQELAALIDSNFTILGAA